MDLIDVSVNLCFNKRSHFYWTIKSFGEALFKGFYVDFYVKVDREIIEDLGDRQTAPYVEYKDDVVVDFIRAVKDEYKGCTFLLSEKDKLEVSGLIKNYIIKKIENE